MHKARSVANALEQLANHGARVSAAGHAYLCGPGAAAVSAASLVHVEAEGSECDGEAARVGSRDSGELILHALPHANWRPTPRCRIRP